MMKGTYMYLTITFAKRGLWHKVNFDLKYEFFFSWTVAGPAVWGCRMYQLHLCSEVRQHLLMSHSKQSVGEAQVMLEF